MVSYPPVHGSTKLQNGMRWSWIFLSNLQKLKQQCDVSGKEIQMNRRRVNALEQILIPELNTQAKYIENAIDEREREDCSA